MNQEPDEELSRKERERLWHRSLMLEAAEELFSRNGYYATNMQEIADVAEFSVGSLYNMFDSKEDLYRQLVNSRVEEYCQEATARMARKTSPLDKCRAVIRYKLEFFDEYRQFFRIFSSFGDGSENESFGVLSAESMGMYEEYQNKLIEIFAAGTREGVFGDIDPSLAVLALEGLTNAIIGRWVQTGEAKLESVDPEIIEEILFRGLLAKEAD